MTAGDLHRIVDPGGASRVVLVHGFTQTLRSWDTLVPAWTTRATVVRVDLPGHGGSARVRTGFPATAAAIGEAGGRAVYVGYSLGGRLCLRLALDRPDLVTALVVLGASPGIDDAVERVARRDADDALAATVERDGTAAFLTRWMAQPLFATLDPAVAGLDERAANPPGGLAASLRLLGSGVQDPLWHRLPGLEPPTRFVAGALDTKFAALAGQMAGLVGRDARVDLVEGAGHAAHLERPGAVAAIVDEVLDATSP